MASSRTLTEPSGRGMRRMSSSEVTENVRVAVRIRPFNSREKKKGCQLTLRVENDALILTSPKDQRVRNFHFDHLYWSFGSLPNRPRASQEEIFSELGTLYVDNAFLGYNSSVFAYGQTGSGKTYTMLGTGRNPGLIPRGCEELFRRIERDYRDGGVQIEVEASYLEVYMDKIFDLLATPTTSGGKRRRDIDPAARDKLPIRFHPKKGAYVEGLTRHAVGNYTDVQRLMAVGLSHRTVAETQMNKISSRSHCIFTLYLNQYGSDGEVTTSKINLIDLAGSERVNKTGVLGQRLEELKKINKSLSALGDVISALSQHAKFIPYNNSVLTTLLSESLGGNSKTIMMAAISPADDNFDETLSTLRYASRVKRITQVARRNHGDNKETVERELRAEIAKLKKLLELRSHGNQDQVNQLSTYLNTQREELRKVKMAHTDRVEEMRDDYEKMRATLEQMGLAALDDFKANSNAPRLINISVDPSLSGHMVFFLAQEETTVGTQDGVPPPTIALTAKDGSISPLHAVIRRQTVLINETRKALSVRYQVWKLLFDECDLNNDSHLNLREFNNWARQILNHDSFQGFNTRDFLDTCRARGADADQGLTFEDVKQLFGGEPEADEYLGGLVTGIPRETTAEPGFVEDVGGLFLQDEYPGSTITLEGEKLRIEFPSPMNPENFKNFKRDLVAFLAETASVSPEIEGISGREEQLVEVQRCVVQSADPTNESAMIFVNRQRVRFEPMEITHGDHVLFGSQHLFQFVSPDQAELSRPGSKEAHEMERNKREMKELLERERAETPRVGDIRQMRQLLGRRMQSDVFWKRNVDVKELKRELLQNRSQSMDVSQVTSQSRDTFMDDYQLIADKANHANQMSISLGKRIVFAVSSLPYFDTTDGVKKDRIIITRSCHYSDPEIMLQMSPTEFEPLVKSMSTYHTLAKNDNEDIALETTGDDPFVPNEVDTLAGEGKLKISGRRLPENGLYEIPILDLGETHVGSIYVQVSLRVLAKNQPPTPVSDLAAAKNKNCNFQIDFHRVELRSPVPSAYITFCVFNVRVQKFVTEPVERNTNVHSFNAQFDADVKMVAPLRTFLKAPGISVRLWVPVFQSISQMPPVIAYKLRSKKVRVRLILPDKRQESLTVRTGNHVVAMKRKIEFQFDVDADDQILVYDSEIMENDKTLLDYNIEEGALIEIDLGGKQRTETIDTDEKEHEYRRRQSIEEISDQITSDLNRQHKARGMSPEELMKHRRRVSSHIHLALLEERSENPEPMTLEAYQEENKRLRNALLDASSKIKSLESKLAKAQQKIDALGGGTGQTKSTLWNRSISEVSEE